MSVFTIPQIRIPSCRLFAAVALSLAVLVAAPLAAQTEGDGFYKGKTLRLIVGYGAGGSADLYGRTIAENWRRHIPGQPAIIVENMPAAGSKAAAAYIYNVAPKDGTALAMVGSNLPADSLLFPDGDKMDMNNFHWIGRMVASAPFGVVWHTAKAKTFADLTTSETVIGGTGPASLSVMVPRAMNSLLGTKFKIIAGYTGSNEVSLAMEKGEIEANAAYSIVTLLSQRPDLLRDNKLSVLFAVSLERHPAFPDVPAIGEMGATPETKAVFRLLASSTDIGRTVIAPPGLTAARVALLRRAFDAMMADPIFLAEAKKRGLDIEPMTGERVADIVREVLAQPGDVIEQTRALAAK